MEFMKATVPVMPLILKPLKAVIKHLVYPFEVSSNIRSLESATADLRALTADVKTEITNAEHDNRMATEEVQRWLDQVEDTKQKAEGICENYRQLSRCIWYISPNIWSNYKISRNAAKKHLEMKTLCDKRVAIQVTVNKSPPLAPEMPASSSKSPNLESALHSIKNEEHGIIGIWGMGGVGKTHLLKQINNELCKDSAFNVVIFVTCSKECSEEKIQDEIIGKLHLDNNGNIEKKKITIYTFLNKRNFILLLDDLWSRVDLEVIGIPDPMVTDDTCKRKIVLTARSTEVCGQMEVRKKIKVDVLKWDDAWSLFKKKVTEETINSDPLIQRCAVDVAKELSGLPLALITIGRAMHDKTDPNEWEQAFELLRKARLDDVEFPSTNKSVFQTLKISYDSLKNETLKQCFLHCSLWPEDHAIKNRDLIGIWMGLGLIDEPNIYGAFNVGYCYIRRLQAVCLLETTDDKRHHVVKMHDVIRDMALWIVSEQGDQKNKWIVQASKYKKSNQIKISAQTEKLSLMYGLTKSVSFSNTCFSNKLSTLLLRGNRMFDSKPLQLDTFSKLAILDLSRNDFEAFPAEICKLLQLQYLNLSYNFSLTSLPEELAALTNLKYLLLLETTKCIIPNGILCKLKALRLLELRYNYLVRGGEDTSGIFTSLEEELQCLSNFEALGISITNMHDFQMLSQTSIVPIYGLNIRILDEKRSLSFASCFLGNSHLQNNLLSLRLNDIPTELVKFEGRGHEQSIYHLGRLEDLYFSRMANMKQIVWIGLNPKNVFSRLQVLHFEFCEKLISISWVVCLPCIRVLQVMFCRSTKQLISIDELNKGGIMVCQPFFPFLNKLILRYNDALEKISDSMIAFPALTVLEIRGCNKLKKLPFETNNPPRKLRLRGNEQWWNNIELNDIAHRSLLQPFFLKDFF